MAKGLRRRTSGFQFTQRCGLHGANFTIFRRVTSQRSGRSALCPAKSKKRGSVAVKRPRSTSRPRALRLLPPSPTDVNSLQAAHESQNHNHHPPMPPDRYRLYNCRRAVVVIGLSNSKSIRLVSTDRRSITRRICRLRNANRDHH